MLKKLEWLQLKLRLPQYEGLSNLTEVTKDKGEFPFRWLCKGKISFRVGSKEQRRLAQKGMKLPERRIHIG